PVPPVERERPLVVHAPSDLEKKGTQHVVAACEQLPVDLDVVHGVPHDEAVERFKRADIVVDQLHYLWHGVFAIESMAYGKPVVTHLDPEAVRQTEEAFGVQVPIVAATKDDLVEKLRPLVESFELRRRLGEEGRAYVERVHDLEQVADRFIDLYRSLLWACTDASKIRGLTPAGSDPSLDARAAEGALPPLGDLRPRLDRRADPGGAAATAVYALPLADGLRPDRDAGCA